MFIHPKKYFKYPSLEKKSIFLQNVPQEMGE